MYKGRIKFKIFPQQIKNLKYFQSRFEFKISPHFHQRFHNFNFFKLKFNVKFSRSGFNLCFQIFFAMFLNRNSVLDFTRISLNEFITPNVSMPYLNCKFSPHFPIIIISNISKPEFSVPERIL